MGLRAGTWPGYPAHPWLRWLRPCSPTPDPRQGRQSGLETDGATPFGSADIPRAPTSKGSQRGPQNSLE